MTCRCWGPCLQGRDVQAVAEPGSGKTLGYLLPAVPMLVREDISTAAVPAQGPKVLILVPTR